LSDNADRLPDEQVSLEHKVSPLGDSSQLEEFGSVSNSRQSILQEIKLPRLVIILIENLFPFLRLLSHDERQKIVLYSDPVQWKRIESSLSVQDRILHAHYQQRLLLLSLSHTFLKYLATNNPPIQGFLSKYLPKLVKNIVLSPSVGACLEVIVKNNEEILMEFSRFGESEGTPQIPAEKRQFSLVVEERLGSDYFERVVENMQLYSRYSEYDILRFLRTLCYSDTKGFTLNQNYIFKLVRNQELFGERVIQTRYNQQLHELMVVFFNEKREQVTIGLRELKAGGQFDNIIKYLVEELNLFVALCKRKNTITTSYFRNKFSLEHLFPYLKDPVVAEQMKAVILKLVSVLHIDSSLLREKRYPQLVKRFREESEVVMQKQILEIVQGRQLQYIDGVALLLGSNGRAGNSEEESETSEIIDKKPAFIETGLLSSMKKTMIEILENRSHDLQFADNSTSTFFNTFTLELLRALKNLLLFGCFSV
jgi:hypothetical protein